MNVKQHFKRSGILYLVLILMSAVNIKAQTDVTATYLTNPSFENSAAGTTFGTGAIDVSGGLYGWTVPSLGTTSNVQVCDNTANASVFGSAVTPSNGTHYYFNRKGWADLSVSLSQKKIIFFFDLFFHFGYSIHTLYLCII
ncbi:MAG: hypothetical protein QM751_00725 [Paludibacteraceae bacterium]